MLAALNPIQNRASIGPILDQLWPLMACLYIYFSWAFIDVCKTLDDE